MSRTKKVCRSGRIGQEYWGKQSAKTGKVLRDVSKFVKKYTARYLRRNPAGKGTVKDRLNSGDARDD